MIRQHSDGSSALSLKLIQNLRLKRRWVLFITWPFGKTAQRSCANLCAGILERNCGLVERNPRIQRIIGSSVLSVYEERDKRPLQNPETVRSRYIDGLHEEDCYFWLPIWSYFKLTTVFWFVLDALWPKLWISNPTLNIVKIYTSKLQESWRRVVNNEKKNDIKITKDTKVYEIKENGKGVQLYIRILRAS